jgi:hypothetical protein
MNAQMCQYSRYLEQAFREKEVKVNLSLDFWPNDVEKQGL